jgi:hypothetical protein
MGAAEEAAREKGFHSMGLATAGDEYAEYRPARALYRELAYVDVARDRGSRLGVGPTQMASVTPTMKSLRRTS